MTLDEIEEKIRTLCGSAPTQDGHVRGDVEAACNIAMALVAHVRALENVTRMTDDRAFERITALEAKVAALSAADDVGRAAARRLPGAVPALAAHAAAAGRWGVSARSFEDEVRVDYLSGDARHGIGLMLAALAESERITWGTADKWNNGRNSGLPADFCAWLIELMKKTDDNAEWFPRGKWATIQRLETLLAEVLPYVTAGKDGG